mmetsp:Transcript_59858/g.81875  ORF Transcript_59858/g.81875 Transcript_59858/m.81875 type:complete len:220 (+) Transcript_59858:631-1290(+)
MERLRVLRPKGLVWCGPSSTYDRHWHLELTTSCCEGVPCAADLRHAVDAEVRVHELNDRPVPIHTLPEGLSDEVALVDDLVGGAQCTKGLLREMGNGVRRASLEVFRVDSCPRIAHHFFEDGQIHCVADCNASICRLSSQALHVCFRIRQGSRVHGAQGNFLRICSDASCIVIRVRRVRKFKLLRKIRRGWWRGFCERHRLFDTSHCLGLACINFVLGE